MESEHVKFYTHDAGFQDILGAEPAIHLVSQDTALPWAHEAGVYVPSQRALYVTSNRLIDDAGGQRIQITKITLDSSPCQVEEIEPTPDIPMANGGVNYKDGIAFCSQGRKSEASGIVFMELTPPYHSSYLVQSFHGRPFNSPNDVIVHRDGSLWFTDPIYGFEQGFRPAPQLPNQVYRYHPASTQIRAVADGFGRPNGLAFSPDQDVLYVTDTDLIHGDGTQDPTRVSSIYAFDVKSISGEPFLTNRRLFAMSDTGVPDGIKCDEKGNVYSGCGDGINVWSPGGVLLGKILISGGVSNFCFCGAGEIMALNETRLWRVILSPICRGALLKL